jgi:hypothetical protein
MTPTMLITVNTILAALVTCGIVWLLGFGIRSDRRARVTLRRASEPLPASDRERIAA